MKIETEFSYENEHSETGEPTALGRWSKKFAPTGSSIVYRFRYDEGNRTKIVVKAYISNRSRIYTARIYPIFMGSVGYCISGKLGESVKTAFGRADPANEEELKLLLEREADRYIWDHIERIEDKKG